MNKQLNVPVLIIAFNRPDNFRKVLNAVRKVAPKVLYIACDGPRLNNEGDIINCAKTRDVVNEIDWPCELNTMFREENVGCGIGPSSAITWAFKKEEKMIILEDDCVPVQSFFSFCEELLDRYEKDSRVWMISGDNYCPIEGCFKESDYIFSNFAHTHGWATWKRCWNEFDIRMSDFLSFLRKGGALNVLPITTAGKLYNKKYLKVYNNIEKEIRHSWDSQWGYARIKNNGLGIVPSRHLIKNIGSVGTHFSHETLVNRINAENFLDDLKHPADVSVNLYYEMQYFKRYIKPMYPSIFERILRRIKRIMTK